MAAHCSGCVFTLCVCVFVFTAICVHIGWVKCRAQIPSMGHHTWPHVMSFSLFHFHSDRPGVRFPKATMVTSSVTNQFSGANANDGFGKCTLGL